MLTDRKIEHLLESVRPCPRVPELVEEVLKRVACCPFCAELFQHSDVLTHHLQKSHQHSLRSSVSKRITGHYVKEGDDTVFICPHCHFAVGFSKVRVYPNPVDTILRHVQECPSNLSRKAGPARVSFSKSRDINLIRAYLRNCAEIALFPCPRCGCDHSFGSGETLVQHLAMDHSGVSSEKLTEEQMRPIRLAAQQFLNERATAKTVTPAAPAQTTKIEAAELPACGAETGPAHVRHRTLDIAGPHPPSPRKSVVFTHDFEKSTRNAFVFRVKAGLEKPQPFLQGGISSEQE